MTRSCFFVFVSWITMISAAIVPEVGHSQTPMPKITVLDYRYHYGSVREGAIVRHAFPIRNDGEAPLLISRVLPGCACGVVGNVPLTINPGKQEVITVEMNTEGFSGSEEREFQFVSNDPKEPVARVTLLGNVLPEIVAEPRALVFPTYYLGQEKKPRQNLIIRTSGQDRPSFLKVQPLSPNIKIVERRDGASEIRAVIELVEFTRPGEIRERIVIRREGRRDFVVPVFGRVEPALKVIPPSLSLGTPRDVSPFRKVFAVKNMSDVPVDVKDVECQGAGVSCEIEEITEGREYSVLLDVSPNNLRSDLHTVVRIIPYESRFGITSAKIHVNKPKG